MKPRPLTIKLPEIVLDAGTQIRVTMNEEIIEDYAQAYRSGAHFPPVDVFAVGNKYLLADGFHRVKAALKAGLKTHRAYVQRGTKSDCIRFALKCNDTHGFRRNNADKRHAVEVAALEFHQISQKALAEMCQVSEELAASVVKTLIESGRLQPEELVIGKDGKAYKRRRPMPRRRRRPMPVSPRVDEAGTVIPETVLPLWNEATENVQEMLTTISGLRGGLRQAEEKRLLMFVRLNYSSVEAHLAQAYAELREMKPFVVCPTCQGLNPASCILCKGTGYLGEFLWKQAVPRETREIVKKARQ